MITPKSLLLVLTLLLIRSAVHAANPLPTIKQYLDAQNNARTKPADLATYISTDIKAKVPSGSQTHSIWLISYSETCPGVFDNAITFLNGASPIGALEVDLGMTYSAWKHAKWMVETNGGTLSHTGSGGSTFSQRLQEYTSASLSACAENILYSGSSYATAQVMVSQYVIDDGVSGRGHRANIYQSSYKKTGLGLYYDTGRSRFYQVTSFADAYNCDKCGTITCAMQQECGWTQYLADAGLADPCKTVNTGSSGSSGAQSTQTPGSSSSSTGTTDTQTSTQKASMLVKFWTSSWLILLVTFGYF